MQIENTNDPNELKNYVSTYQSEFCYISNNYNKQSSISDDKSTINIPSVRLERSPERALEKIPLSLNVPKNYLLIQMLQHQRKNLSYKLRLDLDDLKRIVENINIDFFTNIHDCCLWNGYITVNDKSKYINFYFKHRKIALHRLLYINYIEDLTNKMYLKFKCNNKGICCNINHLEKCNSCITPAGSDNIPLMGLDHISNDIILNSTNSLIETKSNNDKIIQGEHFQIFKLNNDKHITNAILNKNENDKQRKKFIVVLSD